MINQTARAERKEKLKEYFEFITALCVLAGTHDTEIAQYVESGWCYYCSQIARKHQVDPD